MKASSFKYEYLGSSKEVAANRSVFGEAVNSVLDTLSPEEAAKKVLVIDSEPRTTGELSPLLKLSDRRLGGFNWFEGHPSKAPRSFPVVRHY